MELIGGLNGRRRDKQSCQPQGLAVATPDTRIFSPLLYHLSYLA